MLDDPRTFLWGKMLEAHYRYRYFADIASKQRKRATTVTLLVAVLSSGAFATLLTNLPLVAGGCALAATALS